MLWRWAAASAIGTSHLRAGARLQDAYAVTQLPRGQIFAIVSDGAGSATHGASGAWLTCRHFKVRVRQWFANSDCLPGKEEVDDWIDELRDMIAEAAGKRGLTSRQFAATLVALMITETQALAIQIGDSALVGRRNGAWEVLCWPENGEYASSTYFVTDDPVVRLKYVQLVPEFDAFALFTDGIGDVALEQAEKKAYPRFFSPMMRPLDHLEQRGSLRELSAKLHAYLSGASLSERTDDDKTLILLSGS